VIMLGKEVTIKLLKLISNPLYAVVMFIYILKIFAKQTVHID
jgi:hypothetical protein